MKAAMRKKEGRKEGKRREGGKERGTPNVSRGARSHHGGITCMTKHVGKGWWWWVFIGE
jgi:hypothetical protein